MSTLNKCLFLGNLTREVELKKTSSNLPVCNFTIAVSSLRKDESAPTLFLDCTAWRQSAEFLTQHGAKGSQVLVEGHLEPQSWEDRETGEARSKMVLQVESVQLLNRGAAKEAETAAPKAERPAKGSRRQAAA